MIISVLVIAVLIGRAAYLQIYQGEYYAGLADGNRIRIVPSMTPAETDKLVVAYLNQLWAQRGSPNHFKYVFFLFIR